MGVNPKNPVDNPVDKKQKLGRVYLRVGADAGEGRISLCPGARRNSGLSPAVP